MSFLPTLILRVLSLLPLRALHALGTVLGWITYGISPTYRRHLRAHLAQAGYAEARVRRAAIAAAGQMIAEVPALWFRPLPKVAALMRETRGLEQAMAERARGKALLFLTPHMGSFEAAAQYAAALLPVTFLYRPPKIRWLEPLMRGGRARGNARLAPTDLKGVKQLFLALRRGETVAFLPDQVPGKGEGAWAEFFGRPAYTMTLAMRLAERDNVVCYLVYARRLPGGRGYSLEVRPMPAALPGEAAERRLNRGIETLVRECPEQYLWGYNRYKRGAAT